MVDTAAYGLNASRSKAKKSSIWGFLSRGGRVGVDGVRAVIAASPHPCLCLAGDVWQVNEAAQAAFYLAAEVDEAALDAAFGTNLVKNLGLLKSGRKFLAPLIAARSGSPVEATGIPGDGGAPALVWLVDRGDASIAAMREKVLATQTSELGSFQRSLDSLTFPCWRRNERGELVWCNAAYGAALDCSIEAALAEQRELSNNLKDRAGRTLFQRAQRDAQVTTQPKHVVIGGNRRLMEFTETPIEGGTVGFAVDLTVMDELRADLARHISSHSEVLETLTTAVAVFGADQRLKFHNSALCALWQLEENWLATQPTLAEVLEHMREHRQLPEQVDFRRFKQSWLQMFTSLIEPHQELLYRPDGTAIRLAIVPHPMGGLLFTFEDVTSSLALESNYNTLIAVQRETLDHLGEGIAVFASDGRLDLWNPSFNTIWKLPDEELINRPHITALTAKLDAFFPKQPGGDDIKALMISNAIERHSRRGRMTRADNSTIEFNSVSLPDGKVLNSFLDVTDSVRVELALRERNAALIAADQLKLDFLANVSYQLRTPLNAMIGFAEILIKQYFGPLNDKQMEYARGTLEAGEKLVMLVDAILDLSTIEAGYMRLHTAPLNVCAILEDILALAEDWAEKQKVTLIIDCEQSVGTIEADERRLKQVLLNLISNGLKFTPHGGTITLSAHRLQSEGREEVALAVADTGSGIPEADQSRIFEPFEQAGQRKFASSATGVGLALVKSFVTLHGGRIELKSKQGEGTVVTCYLPISQPSQVAEG